MKAHEVKRIQDPQVEEAFRQLEENNDGAWRFVLVLALLGLLGAYCLMSPVETWQEKESKWMNKR